MRKLNKLETSFRTYVLYFLILSLLISGVTFSKYVTKSEGSDLARVSSIGDVEITEIGDFYEDGKLWIIPGVNPDMRAIANYEGSESVSYLFLRVDADSFTKVSSDEFVIEGDGEELVKWGMESGWNYLLEDKGEYVYYIEVPANEVVEKDIVAENKVYVSKYVTEDKLEEWGSLYIKLNIKAIQKGNFTAEQAWNSLNGGGN